MVLERLAGGLSRWLLVPALCAALAGCRTTTLVDSSAVTALQVPNRAGELVVRTPEGHPLHIGKGSRLSFLLRDGSWTDPIEGRDLCVSEQAVARCAGEDGPGLVLRWADVTGVEVDNFDGLKTFGAVVLVTALVAVVVVVVVLGVRGGGLGGGGGGGGGGGHLGGGGGGGHFRWRRRGRRAPRCRRRGRWALRRRKRAWIGLGPRRDRIARAIRAIRPCADELGRTFAGRVRRRP